ncbi:hypothetical protein EPN16_02195 [bacterium]|jgi:hypothetical protein|nr:MAG: hypothetical protein EPN16_02195 [bacterium]
MTGTVLNLEKDFIASSLRALINRLQDVLSVIEEGGSSENEFTANSLKSAETHLRQIRRFCTGG